MDDVFVTRARLGVVDEPSGQVAVIRKSKLPFAPGVSPPWNPGRVTVPVNATAWSVSS